MAQYTQINPEALVTALTPINDSINEINTKIGNLTGALVWKGKFDTLPAVTDYEAGNVVGVGNKEYVLTVTENTKTWEELGDEGSYLLKSTAEETYAKKTDIPTVPEVNNPKVSVKMNGTEKGSFTLNQATDGEVDLGTVITAHQDISGKVDKTLNAKSLELIYILSSNSDRDKAANKAAIKAYIDNLTALGVDTTKNFNIPVYINYYGYGCLTACRYGGGYTYIYLIGILFNPETGGDDSRSTIVKVSYNTGEVIVIQSIYNDETLATTNKSLVGAINEVNTLAKSKGNGTITEVKMNGVSKGTSGVVDLGTVLTEHQDISGKVDKTLNAKSLEAITIKTSNSDADISANVTAIKAYVDNLTALGVDTTKGFNVPAILNIDYKKFYGCLTCYCITNTFCFLSGTIFSVDGGEYYIKDIYIAPSGVYSEIVSIKNDNDLNTTSKSLVGAINEVNTLAKSKGNGTITEVKMNGVSKGTSGVVDLGTVLTEHQSLKTINGKTITGSGNIEISAPSITVDPSMSDTSTNPVQNKVIKAYIDDILGTVSTQLAAI